MQLVFVTANEMNQTIEDLRNRIINSMNEIRKIDI